MAFLAQSGDALYWFQSDFIGGNPNLKGWIYITPDNVDVVTAAGYFTPIPAPRSISEGDLVTVYTVTDRNNLDTTTRTFRLRITAIDIATATLTVTADDIKADVGIFDTASMAATASPPTGAGFRTFGYTTVGDLGAARYVVVDTDPDDDGAFALANGKFASIVEPELTPYMFGATGGDAALDMAAINKALAVGVARGRPVILNGTLAVAAPATDAGYKWGKRTGYEVYVSIPLKSGMRVYSRDGSIMVKTPGWGTLTSNQHHFVFGSADQYTTAGTLKDIEIEGLTFDFSDPDQTLAAFTYAIGAIGVDRLYRRNIRHVGTDGTLGRGIITENCRWRRDINITHRNWEQGAYLRYDDDMDVDGFAVDGFVEAFDIDGPCLRPHVRNVRATNGVTGRENQVLDISAVQHGLFDGVVADGANGVAFVYGKQDSWPAYQDWLDHNADATWLDGSAVDVVTTVETRDVTIKGVRARNCGKAGEETFRIGNYRDSTDNYGKCTVPPARITLADWKLESCYQGQVNECKALAIDGMMLSSMAPGTGGTSSSNPGFALVLRQSQHDTDAQAASILSGVVRGVRVKSSAGGGLLVSGPATLALRDIDVDGYNSQANGSTKYGVVADRLSVKAGRLILDNLKISGGTTDGTSCADLTLNYVSAAGSAARRISAHDVTLGSTASGALPFQTDSLKVGEAVTGRLYIPLGPIDTTLATGASAVNVPIVLSAASAHQVLYAALVNADAIAGDGTDFTSCALQNVTGGTAATLGGSSLSIDNAAVSAGSEREMALSGSNAKLAAGSLLQFHCARNGSGSKTPPLVLVLTAVPFDTVV